MQALANCCMNYNSFNGLFWLVLESMIFATTIDLVRHSFANFRHHIMYMNETLCNIHEWDTLVTIVTSLTGLFWSRRALEVMQIHRKAHPMNLDYGLQLGTACWTWLVLSIPIFTNWNLPHLTQLTEPSKDFVSLTPAWHHSFPPFWCLLWYHQFVPT